MTSTKSVFLPDDSICNFEINFNGTKQTIDIFTLEDLFFQANDIAKKKATEWYNEFPDIFASHQYKPAGKGKKRAVKPKKMTGNQARWLYTAMTTQIDEIKKKLHGESKGSKETASSSP